MITMVFDMLELPAMNVGMHLDGNGMVAPGCAGSVLARVGSPAHLAR
jgi:hypothetical protein